MQEAIIYQPLPMESWDFPVRVAKRTNNAEDIGRYEWPLHWHEQMEFQYVLAGGIEILCRGRREWVYAGDVFFANWCEPHCSTAFLDGTRYYAVHLNVQWLMLSDEHRLSRYIDYMMTHGEEFGHVIRRDGALCSLLDRVIAEQEHRQVGYELNLIVNILVHLRRTCALPAAQEPTGARQPRAGARRVPRVLAAQGNLSGSALQYNREILHYLSHHYQQPLDLDGLAKEIGLNKYYMCRIFKLFSGRSIIQYLNHLRCYMAVSIISNGFSVTEAAEMTGFGDYNYFSRVFKRVTGRRPSEVARELDSTARFGSFR